MKEDFPILKREINGHTLVYLDNAATSQKPKQVIDAISDFYFEHNANIHRGIHTLSEEATEMYENSRKIIAGFIGSSKPEEVIFTKGTTDSLNMVAFSWALPTLKEGDQILLTQAEHHSNLVPWQEVAKRTGAKLVYIEIDKQGKLNINDLKTKLTEKAKVVAITHASNVLGTIFPVKRICEMAHEVGAVVVVDGAQAAPHIPINVQSLGCDFYAFSGHKMLGPTGIGVLWGKKELLEKMKPYQYGGGMIDVVDWEESTYASLPERLEAGTPNAAGAVGLAAAIEYLNKYGMENVRKHEVELNSYALQVLPEIEGLKILGPINPEERTGLVSFTLEGIHPHDIAAVLNNEGVAVRSGHHCNMPLHKLLSVPATTRASWYIYNSKEDIDSLVFGINKAKKLLSVEKSLKEN